MKIQKFFLIILLSSTALFSLYAKPGDRMYVAVETAAVKSGTGFFASTLTELVYGDTVTVVEENGKWIHVSVDRNRNIKGWVTLASLTTKRIVARAGGGTVSATAEELALAGKGFSADVEQSWKNTSGTDYTYVDIMEEYMVSVTELHEFITSGDLKGAEE
ncbi:MAG: hypothetical protein LBU99_01275 [Spirochaetaceae bacterium]|jgi:uncharacterized protein YgiM (DUF1202 family)|nr:hypothetical protein [Spirochaetaceae bacterium]